MFFLQRENTRLLCTEWKYSLYISCLSSSSMLFFSSHSSSLPPSIPPIFRLFSCQYHVWKVSPWVSLGLVNLSAAAWLKGRLLAQEGQEHRRSHGAFFSLQTHGCCFRHVLFRETTSLGTCVGPRGVAFSVTPVFDEDFLYKEVGVLVIPKVHSNQLSVQTRKKPIHTCLYLSSCKDFSA